VNKVVVQQANGIACFGTAQPLLAVPSNEIQLLDMRRDYFVASLPRPEFPLVVAAEKPGWKGRVIAFNAGFFHDPYEGVTGKRFPGIGAADNAKFATNLLHMLTAGTAPETETWEAMQALISDIETTLSHLAERTLCLIQGADWFDYLVPEGVRNKCITKQRTENPRFPAPAYLDLVDFKQIFRANWERLQAIGVLQSVRKNEVSERIQDVNELRKPAMHAAKRVFGRVDEPEAGALSRLREHRDFFRGLLSAVGPLRNVREGA
jgi:hypothetical protein